MVASRKSMCTIISIDLEKINVCLYRLSNTDKNSTFSAERQHKKDLDPHKNTFMEKKSMMLSSQECNEMGQNIDLDLLSFGTIAVYHHSAVQEISKLQYFVHNF